MTSPQPPPAIQSRVARIVGWPPQAWRPVTGGYTPAARFIAAAADKSAFVKIATTPLTASMLRREALAYQRLVGQFMPRLLGWEDHETSPILVVEDLSEARWPPPWDRPLIDTVLAGLADMHAGSAELPSFHRVHGAAALNGWSTIAAAPEPFLALRLVTPAGLDQALPTLVEAEARCVATDRP